MSSSLLGPIPRLQGCRYCSCWARPSRPFGLFFPTIQHLLMPRNSFSSRARKEEWGANQSPYEILQCSSTATPKEIKLAYFKQAKQHHPDMHPNDQEEAKKRFQVISSAYELLSDPTKRTRYDNDVRANRWSSKSRGSAASNAHTKNAWRDSSYANQQQYTHNPHSWQYRTSSQNNYYYSQRVWSTVQQVGTLFSLASSLLLVPALYL